jgi:hypothetical protein
LRKEDTIDPSVWEARRIGTLWSFQQPGMRQWWSEWRPVYPADFRGFIDGLIREGEAAV